LPKQIADTRTFLHIPVDAHNFDVELFYLYVFIASTSIQIAYRDKVPLSVEIGKSLMDYMNDAITASDGLPFRASTEKMLQRYRQYHELLERGVEELIEHLPFMFLVSNGVCRSDSRDDMQAIGGPLITMQVWIGKLLTQLLSAHQQLCKGRTESVAAGGRKT
jgi:hypothetical protein